MRCKMCGESCAVPLPPDAPEEARLVLGPYSQLLTCPEGQRQDLRRHGWNYNAILLETWKQDVRLKRLAELAGRPLEEVLELLQSCASHGKPLLNWYDFLVRALPDDPRLANERIERMRAAL